MQIMSLGKFVLIIFVLISKKKETFDLFILLIEKEKFSFQQIIKWFGDLILFFFSFSNHLY